MFSVLNPFGYTNFIAVLISVVNLILLMATVYDDNKLSCEINLTLFDSNLFPCPISNSMFPY